MKEMTKETSGMTTTNKQHVHYDLIVEWLGDPITETIEL